MLANPFMKIERDEPLSNKVEQQIREAIRQKIFLPGDKLPGELELAERFGVSRTAIREALRMLAGRGLVDIQKGSGAYVSEIDMSNVVDPFYQLLEMKCGEAALLHIIRVRCFIEPEIAKLAANYCDNEDIEYLKRNYENMKQHAENPEEMIDIDTKFHRRLAEATNNPILPIIMEPIYQLLHKFISSTYKQSHAPDLALENHRKLVQCMEEKNGEMGFIIMKQHMFQAEQHVIQYYESIGFTNY